MILWGADTWRRRGASEKPRELPTTQWFVKIIFDSLASGKSVGGAEIGAQLAGRGTKQVGHAARVTKVW